MYMQAVAGMYSKVIIQFAVLQVIVCIETLNWLSLDNNVHRKRGQNSPADTAVFCLKLGVVKFTICKFFFLKFTICKLFSRKFLMKFTICKSFSHKFLTCLLTLVLLWALIAKKCRNTQTKLLFLVHGTTLFLQVRAITNYHAAITTNEDSVTEYSISLLRVF